jgi:hypothetical protein
MGRLMRQKSCAGAFHCEKSQRADTQISVSGVSYVPKPDPYNMEVGDELPKGDTQNFMTRYKAILYCDFSFSD